MAVSVSRRILKSLGSSSSFLCRFESSKTIHSSFQSSTAFNGSALESSTKFFKGGFSSFIACRRLSTTILTPQSCEGAFPPELLSKKTVLTPDRTQGCYEDLVIPVTNFHNEDKGYMVLAGDVFDVPIRKDIVHRVVRWQLAKRRQGTHSTKTISEVSGTGRKPWPQKGTGRARHGTLRGPQFRHGATMHGPKPKSHAYKLQKKVRRLGLKCALSARTAEGKASLSIHSDNPCLYLYLLIFDDLDVPTHKTKNIVNYVEQMENSKKLLLVDGGPINEKLKLATQNLHYVNVLPSIGLNVYSILLHDTLVMSRDAVNRIVERMHTPINR
ncbi:Ribosomal protein L4/L1e [Macleaya cordata]|uniref:Large ribosomal subunit protein uL4m n=1 Tax=Macleaya cordata TaxID=56857 RepID=A0A200PYZ3_MACCD|nr:Ribosomal protein L4/L1e [Macleaya cordata]